jgi:hypothetical protein
MVKAPTPAFMPSFNGPEGQEDMPWLMTAGPVVTSREVKLAMLADWSVRDAEFTSLVLRVTEEVLQLANAAETHDCIPLNMSGMAALESIAGALCPSGRKRLTLVAGSGPCAEQLTTILTHNQAPVAADESSGAQTGHRQATGQGTGRCTRNPDGLSCARGPGHRHREPGRGARRACS